MSAGWLAEQANRPRVVYEERATDVRGRARKKAELKKLDAESKVLQEELNHLSQLPPASAACQELLSWFQRVPDPFLESFDYESRPNRWHGVSNKRRSTGCFSSKR
jgi:hypothetical protein